MLYVQDSGQPHLAHTRLAALFLLAVGVRMLYIYSTPPESPIGSTDAWGYHRLAFNLDRGNGFSLRRRAPFVPDSVRTPLYPITLLLVRRTLGPSPRAAVVLQALLDSVTTLGAYRLATLAVNALTARRRGVGLNASAPSPRRTLSPASQRAGRLAALLYALNPVQVRHVNELLTETLLSFLLTCCFCVLIQTVRAQAHTPVLSRRVGTQKVRDNLQALTLGFLTGLAALCKPNVQFLPLIWLPCIVLARPWIARKRARRQDDACPEWRPSKVQRTRPTQSGREQVHRPRRPSEWRPSEWQPLTWRTSGLAQAGLMGIAFLVTVSPWITRNALVFGRPFLSTAFEGNVSHVSAPATLITARGEYAIPWSAQWEAAFGEIVSQTALRYGWDTPWEALSTRELDLANRQVYRIARQVLARHPLAWLGSHTLGMLRYIEPQIYRVLHTRFAGQPWPPDILDDAVIHTVRAALGGNWDRAGSIVAWERWVRLTPFQRVLWWGLLLAQHIGCILMLRGAWRMRVRPALAIGLIGSLAYILWLPGPIAYERFRVPVLSLVVTLIAVGTVPDTVSGPPDEASGSRKAT